jgi:hypothetical protein
MAANNFYRRALAAAGGGVQGLAPGASWLSRMMRSWPSLTFFTLYWKPPASSGNWRTIL